MVGAGRAARGRLVAVSGNVSARVEVVGLDPAHLPRLVQAVRAAVEAVRPLAMDAGPG